MDTGAELRGLPGGPGGVGHVGRCGGQWKHMAPPTWPTQPPGEQGSWHGAPSTCLAVRGALARRCGLTLGSGSFSSFSSGSVLGRSGSKAWEGLEEPNPVNG